MEELYRKAAERIARARYGAALTGAGISVESGIPDFRSPDGLWSRYDPMEYGYIESFRRNPGRVWKMLIEMTGLLDRAMPNPAHIGLAELEKLGCVKTVITQNIDSLHQKAGNTDVIEFHGHARTLRCDDCSKRYDPGEVSLESLPPRCSCGGPLRPDVVFFGEPIPPIALHRAMDVARSCDVMMVIGTSATVAPASTIPVIAKENGAFIIEINPSPSALTGHVTDVYIPESAGKAVSEIVAIVREIKGYQEL
ncbi:SIR2 family NAD-dependent protein deacylase [Thermodesulforhabdus norvegica]|uniref:protein acetyllysine N-acetyltransferase n=1 Tax=Thermodesulforhabdus norvegica TaxID=39841 RepID=A0A1I4TEN4_9BACT|nr:NAD-dependent deacylase [Thermodesulforhabdus norvegica]SFM75166.1 NAD-dependent deacetylase [Thermodesulforhabdus norvegica]